MHYFARLLCIFYNILLVAQIVHLMHFLMHPDTCSSRAN